MSDTWLGTVGGVITLPIGFAVGAGTTYIGSAAGAALAYKAAFGLAALGVTAPAWVPVAAAVVAGCLVAAVCMGTALWLEKRLNSPWLEKRLNSPFISGMMMGSFVGAVVLAVSVLVVLGGGPTAPAAAKPLAALVTKAAPALA